MLIGGNNMTQEDIVKLTKEVADKYEVKIDNIEFRKRKNALGMVITKKDGQVIIVYSTDLLKRPEYDIKHTVYHEVAHVVAYKRYGRRQHHNYKFQRIESEIHKAYGMTTIYDRNRGYAIAIKDLTTGQYLWVNAKYKVEDGKLINNNDYCRNVKILKRIFFNLYLNPAVRIAKIKKYGDVMLKNVNQMAKLLSSNGEAIWEIENEQPDCEIKLLDFTITKRGIKYKLER